MIDSLGHSAAALNTKLQKIVWKGNLEASAGK